MENENGNKAKKRPRRRKRVPLFINIIESIDGEVHKILDNDDEARYFYALLLCYSFIENILKHLNVNKVFWDAADREMSDEEAERIKKEHLDETFYAATRRAEKDALAKQPRLVKWLDDIRKRRNSLVHQLWL